MSDFLEFTLDKFTFRVATDRVYSPEGVWVQAAGGRATLGVSDFFQQHHGDVAFAEVRDVGTAVSPGDPVAAIETIKVDVDLPSPVSGTIVAVNEALELEAERINHDPYGAGWLAVIETADWAADRTRLLSPAAYFELMKCQAQEETASQ